MKILERRVLSRLLRSSDGVSVKIGSAPVGDTCYNSFSSTRGCRLTMSPSWPARCEAASNDSGNGFAGKISLEAVSGLTKPTQRASTSHHGGIGASTRL